MVQPCKRYNLPSTDPRLSDGLTIKSYADLFGQTISSTLPACTRFILRPPPMMIARCDRCAACLRC